MSFGGAILTAVAFVWGVFFYRSHLLGDHAHYNWKWLVKWAIKGVAIPCILWTIFNSGFSAKMPPIFTFSNSPNWWTRTSAQVGPGIAMVTTYWGALTLIWCLAVVFMEAEKESRKDFLLGSFVWCVIMTPIAGVILLAGGLTTLGYALVVWVLPLIHSTMSLLVKVIPTPMYSRAIAAMKLGKYAEAEQQVIQQLEKCENDFDGWMMLAELYANHFHDIREAERTISGLIDDPTVTGTQVAVALHRLADWELKLGNNPLAARQVLEQICKRYPNTHLAKMARLRINQIPESVEAYNEAQKAKTVRMPALNDDMFWNREEEPRKVDVSVATLEANQCVEKLKQDPNDVEVREQLARILAEQLGSVHAGMEQLELLIGMPEQSEKKIPEWLGLMASWQMRYRSDTAAARRILERLMREYPASPQAFTAQRHIHLMEEEERIQKRKAAEVNPKPKIRLAV
jgi:tetratricopeptide (TPR) repeat protein